MDWLDRNLGGGGTSRINQLHVSDFALFWLNKQVYMSVPKLCFVFFLSVISWMVHQSSGCTVVSWCHQPSKKNLWVPGLGLFCVEYAWSPCVFCVLPTVQQQTWGQLGTKVTVGACKCKWMSVVACLSVGLGACPECHTAFALRQLGETLSAGLQLVLITQC